MRPRATWPRRAAAAGLARSRQALLDHLAVPWRGPGSVEGAGWFAGVRAAGGGWWRVHPARAALELAVPALARCARRRPAQFLAVAAAGGALLAVTRPWRLLSVTGLLFALVKSSRLSSLLPVALAALRPRALPAARARPTADRPWPRHDAS